jgi:ankyrin repeat protein
MYPTFGPKIHDSPFNVIAIFSMALTRTWISFGNLGISYTLIDGKITLPKGQSLTVLTPDKVDPWRNALFLTDPHVDREILKSAKGTGVPGTCEWITQDKSYQSWLRGDTNLLWISGGPGQGKTMLSIFLTEELEGITQKMEDAELLFYFCRYPDETCNTAVDLLRGLVHQIVVKRPKLAKHVLPYVDTPAKSEEALSSLEALWVIFRRLVQDFDFGTMFCVLDGLDECDDTLKALVQKIVYMFSPDNSHSVAVTFKLVIFSRDLDVLHDCPQVKLDLDNNERVASDMKLFISVKVEELSKIEGFNEEFRTTLQNTLFERSQGTYLWVSFVVNELSHKRRSMEALKTSCSFPKGLLAAYSHMLLQIERSQICVTSKILRWVVMAFRPLTLQELAAAIGIQSAASVTVEQAVRDQVALCGLFLQVRGQEVSLIHRSARGYLLRKERDSNEVLEEFRIKPEEAHLEIAQGCFDCVAQSDLKYTPLDLYAESCSEKFPLLKYASLHWPEHARSCSTLVAELFRSSRSFFFERDSELRKNWWQSQRRVEWPLAKSTVPLLHMACHLGIVPWVQAVLSKARMPSFNKLADKKDNEGWAALHHAADRGHEAVVGLLVEHGADADVRDNDGYTALHLAANHGHVAVVRLLVERGADLNTKDYYTHKTALYRAAGRGYTEVVRLLVENGADINEIYHNANTAVCRAAENGYEEVVRLLVERGADMNGKHCKTPLCWAANNGHEEVVRLLVDCGADINVQDSYSENTTLCCAAENGHEEVVRFLVERGADINAKGIHADVTALSKAAENGHEEVVRLLIGYGADVKVTTKYAETALDRAARNRHDEIVRLLVNYRPYVEATAKYGETALHRVAMFGMDGLDRLEYWVHTVYRTTENQSRSVHSSRGLKSVSIGSLVRASGRLVSSLDKIYVVQEQASTTQQEPGTVSTAVSIILILIK